MQARTTEVMDQPRDQVAVAAEKRRYVADLLQEIEQAAKCGALKQPGLPFDHRSRAGLGEGSEGLQAPQRRTAEKALNLGVVERRGDAVGLILACRRQGAIAILRGARADRASFRVTEQVEDHRAAPPVLADYPASASICASARWKWITAPS